MEILVGSLRLGAAVWLVAAAARRWAPRLLPGRAAGSEVFLRGFLVATLAIVLSVAAAGTAGLLGAWTLLALAAALYGAAYLFTPHPAAVGRRQPIPWPLWPVFVLLLVDVVTFLPGSPVNWDAVTYHLYFPARWLQEGRLFHVPAVFSDNSAAFAPQNGALFFAWQMALLGRDATTDVAQALCLVFLAVASYRIALLAGFRRRPALMAATICFWIVPLRMWTWSANVDVFMAAFFTGAVYWLLLYFRRREPGSLMACGLAAGLAAGTKTLGLPLAAVPAVAMTILLLKERRFGAAAAFAAAVVAGGGWWYLLNLWLYGNPLFPLDFGLPGLHFAGAYSADTFRQSQFRIAGIERWVESVGVQLGWPTVAVALVGGVGLLKRRRPVSLSLAAFALSWAAYVFVVVPHNNQARFLIPSLVLGLLGWARWFGASTRREARVGLYVAVLAAAAWASRPELAWAFHLERLAASGVGVVGWLVLATAAALLGGWTLRASRRPSLAVASWVIACLTVALAASYADRSRVAFYARADYLAWGAGYLMFNDPTLEPRRIAYSGLNVPYALMGPGWRHLVVYCNTQGGEADGFYDFWARDRRLHSTPKPGIYRGDDDYEVWRACLERRRIDTVVLFWMIPLRLPQSWRTSDGFPIERQWVRRRPELYRPLVLTERAEIYEVRR